MAQSAKYKVGDKISFRNMATPEAKSEVIGVHWNKIASRWEYNILSQTGSRQLNIAETDLLVLAPTKKPAAVKKVAVEKKAAAKAPIAKTSSKPKAAAKKKATKKT